MKLNFNQKSANPLKNVMIVFFIALALTGCDLLTSAEKLKAEAQTSLTARNFTSAALTAQKWIEKSPNSYEAYFVLAQAQAQVGDKNAALVALEHSIQKGLKDDVQIESNQLLDPIKTMVAFQALMNAQFPGRKSAQNNGLEGNSGTTNSEVSITEKDGQQTLRAGDVVIQMPILK